MKFLLDTNTCIFIIKKHPPKVVHKLSQLNLEDVGISSITLAELNYGIEKSIYQEKNRQALNEFLAPLNIFSFDEEAAHQYGVVRNYLTKKGGLIGSLDMMIAAHALSLECTLVTNNKKEFFRVPELSIEDWTVVVSAEVF